MQKREINGGGGGGHVTASWRRPQAFFSHKYQHKKQKKSKVDISTSTTLPLLPFGALDL